MEDLKSALKEACKIFFNVEVEPELTRPEEELGDYSSNVALQLAGQLNKKPQEIAETLKRGLEELDVVEKVEVAGPGFINIWLKDKTILSLASSATSLPKPLAGQTVVAEYSDPNPFKVLHAGHLYTSIVGDALANLFEQAGAKVYRVNFGGDVGLHVAKAMWGMLKNLGGEQPGKLDEIRANERAAWISGCYVSGNRAYEEGEKAKQEITQLNKRIYQIHEQQDKTSEFAKIYWTTRQWSYEYFDEFYKQIGSHFDKYYPESETVELGLKAVKDNLGRVFEQSDGAVVFKGEVHNMHTRVFINSQGLPTYETKDVGLLLKKWQDYHFDKSIVITGNDIYDYMQVVLKAVEQFEPELARKTTHITHGMVKLAGGKKMSSREGNILLATDVLDSAAAANQKLSGKDQLPITLGAVKYAFLKQGIGGDIIYEPEESVVITGNSGPYLQYAYARATSILKKTSGQNGSEAEIEPDERVLALKISQYPEVVARAISELAPSTICTYLYELAQQFNRFYESNRVVGDPREGFRAKLVSSYAEVLKSGLGLLNIEAPERV